MSGCVMKNLKFLHRILSYRKLCHSPLLCVNWPPSRVQPRRGRSRRFIVVVLKFETACRLLSIVNWSFSPMFVGDDSGKTFLWTDDWLAVAFIQWSCSISCHPHIVPSPRPLLVKWSRRSGLLLLILLVSFANHMEFDTFESSSVEGIFCYEMGTRIKSRCSGG